MTTSLHVKAFAAFMVALALTACGGGESDGPTSPSAPPISGPAGTTINISGNAVSPKTLTVPAGTRVTFTNNDSRVHDMASDPHPNHTDCIEINQAGFLQPGQARETGNLNTPRTCGFHDHNQDSNTALQGTIVIR